jgi:tyrosine-protein kinase Etk/Wzc
MNSPQPLPPVVPADAGDEINLFELVDVVLDSRWLIAAITALALVIGVAYALFSTPIYQANTLIQVESSKGGADASNLLGQASSLFDIQSPAAAEIELLRSRFVVGKAVENLKLDMKTQPRYLPFIGRWLAKRAKEPSNPGILGFGGFVSGNESLTIGQFQVPKPLESKRFRVRLVADGYELISPDGDVLGRGRFNEVLSFMVEDQGAGRLLVTDAIGKPGAVFNVTRYSTLDTTEELQKDLAIGEVGRQSGVIRASLQGDDAEAVARVLNEIGTLYVRQNVERKAAEAEKSLDFLSAFLPELRKQVDNSESAFNQFRRRTGTFDLGAEGQTLLDQGVKLQTNLLELQQKRKQLLPLYAPEHYTIKAIDAQIASVNAELTTLNNRAKTLPDIEQDLLRLTRDVKVNNELYVNLLNAAQQLRLAKEGKVGNVRVVDVAQAPNKPVKPQRTLIVALSLVLGLLLGVALAFVRNSLRVGLKDSETIEQRTGLHVFTSVPHSEAQAKQILNAGSKARGNHVLAVIAPQDPAVESMRSLRTALQFAMLDAANNVVLITGPTPGIGKSFVCVNLAVVLGAANKKILLIDADLRKGYMNQYFGLEREKGISEVVSGSVRLDDALRRQVAPNVDFLPTGILPPNPAELLMSLATVELVREASKHYDLVLIDTPPVLAASDTAVLAPLAGVVFLIARAEITSVGELQEASKRLLDTGVKVKGVIFNGVKISKRRYGYGQYSGYRYTNYKY